MTCLSYDIFREVEWLFFFSVKSHLTCSPVVSSAEEGSWSSSGLLWLFVIHCASSVYDPVAHHGYQLVEQSRGDMMASNIWELGMDPSAKSTVSKYDLLWIVILFPPSKQEGSAMMKTMDLGLKTSALLFVSVNI